MVRIKDFVLLMKHYVKYFVVHLYKRRLWPLCASKQLRLYTHNGLLCFSLRCVYFYVTDSTTRAILCIRCGISVAVSWKFQRNSYTHLHKYPKRSSGKDCHVNICQWQCHTAENYFCSESVEKFKTNNKVYEMAIGMQTATLFHWSQFFNTV